jgi:LEA14-like dessication related protein
MFVSIMESDTKKIVGTLAVMAAIGGGFYLIKKGKRLLSGAKMNFALLGFRIHKLTLQEVQFAVKLRCYNPTKSPITLAVNQVVAKYKGSAIAFSTPDIKGLTIAAGSSQEIEIKFQVPYLNLMGKGITMALLNDVKQLKADMSFTLTISLNGETITTTQNLTSKNMNGLGQLGIVSGPRDTKDGREFNHLIKRAANKDVFVKNGNVLETVESCVNIIAEHHKEVEGLAAKLEADTVKGTCRNIFNFAYTYLQYQKDEDGTEQLRTPARSWQDGQIKFKQQGVKSAGIDCDDYSIFCGSLLKCMNIPFKIRITKYNGNSYFQHIYVYVPAKGDSEDEIIIDPVLSKFDYQKPYSFEQSNFNLSPLQMVAGVHGINGLTGTVGLGLPIYALSGIDMAGGRMVDNGHTDLMAIVSGIDFDDNMSGLGNPETATLNYLRRTRDFLLKSKENKSKMAHIQNPDQFISMLDQAIKYWHTPKRDKVLDKLIAIEDKLAENGFIKYDIDAINGFNEFDELEDEPDGLEGKREQRAKRRTKRKKRRARFFKAVKRIGKKVGNAAKKVAKAIVKYNPLSIAIRGGLLVALRLNMFGISKKLQYAYLPISAASKHNIDVAKLKDLKKRHARVKKLFRGLQGKESNLKNAILKGAKQRNSDFSLKGTNDILSQLKGLEAVGELAQLGDLGVVAAAASVGAASGVLAKIKSWLRPVKNIFNKVRGRAASKKIEKLIAKGKEISPKLRQRVRQYYQQQRANQPNGQEPAMPTIPTPTNYSPTIPYAPQQAPYEAGQMSTHVSPIKGMSKKVKVGVGIGVAALIGTGAYLMLRSKPQTKSKPIKSQKETLGSITLQ